MDLRQVGYVLGFLLAVLAAAMLVPALLAFAVADGEGPVFLTSAAVCLAAAGLLVLGLRSPQLGLDRRQAFLLTSLAWCVLPVFGALPLLWGGLGLDLADAVFESVSGLTTTGSTVLSGLDGLAPSILLWRALLQWLGGIGIIAMGIAILPFLKVGGMQIFHLESSDRSEKIVPRASTFALLLLTVYGGLTLVCTLAYWAAGMTPFEAICHAMATISTGGYSTSDGSMGHFPSPALHWLATLFMLSGGIPFALYIQALRGRPLRLWRDPQVRGFVVLLAVVSLGLGLWLAWTAEMSFDVALRLASFNVVSVVTTTGFATDDYTLWGSFAVALFYFLTFVGGCSGSTSGGYKIYRFQIFAELYVSLTRRLVTPHGLFVARYDGRPVAGETAISIATFTGLFVATILVLALSLAAMGLDLVTSFSGAATAVANVGPGLGPLIGPAGNFASLPDAAKWLLSLGMILGRLEIVTMAVLLVPHFWRA